MLLIFAQFNSILPVIVSNDLKRSTAMLTWWIQASWDKDTLILKGRKNSSKRYSHNQYFQFWQERLLIPKLCTELKEAASSTPVPSLLQKQFHWITNVKNFRFGTRSSLLFSLWQWRRLIACGVQVNYVGMVRSRCLYGGCRVGRRPHTFLPVQQKQWEHQLSRLSRKHTSIP